MPVDKQQEVSQVGILGGGQLARMMALAGIPLGLEFHILDPSSEACAAQLASFQQAGFSDLEAISALASHIDVATFDFENVPADSARALAELKPFQPGVLALENCQDRLLEKGLLSSLDIPVPGYQEVSSRIELLQAIEKYGFPSVLKTRRLGYDGKGQVVLRQQEDLEPAWQKLGHQELILEAFVPFDAECSLLAVRSESGELKYWPLTRNVHDNGMLVLSRPGGLGEKLQQQAEHIASVLFAHWNYVGVMAVEFFILKGKLLVNEVAPRVHNSGHWTLDASSTSQFENHLRAVCSLPLGETSASGHALMFNWISNLPDIKTCLAVEGLHWHDYGKAPRAGRKLGHATLVAADAKELSDRAGSLAAQLGGRWPALLEQLNCAI